jgi:hypothetical protein
MVSIPQICDVHKVEKERKNRKHGNFSLLASGSRKVSSRNEESQPGKRKAGRLEAGKRRQTTGKSATETGKPSLGKQERQSRERTEDEW